MTPDEELRLIAVTRTLTEMVHKLAQEVGKVRDRVRDLEADNESLRGLIAELQRGIVAFK